MLLSFWDMTTKQCTDDGQTMNNDNGWVMDWRWLPLHRLCISGRWGWPATKHDNDMWQLATCSMLQLHKKVHHEYFWVQNVPFLVQISIFFWEWILMAWGATCPAPSQSQPHKGFLTRCLEPITCNDRLEVGSLDSKLTYATNPSLIRLL